MDLKGLLGGVGVSSTMAAAFDLLVTGGDVVFWLLEFAIGQGPLIYIVLARLSVLAPEVAWLPAARIQTALYVVAAVVTVFAVYRLVRNFVKSWRENYGS